MTTYLVLVTFATTVAAEAVVTTTTPNLVYTAATTVSQSQPHAEH